MLLIRNIHPDYSGNKAGDDSGRLTARIGLARTRWGWTGLQCTGQVCTKRRIKLLSSALTIKLIPLQGIKNGMAAQEKSPPATMLSYGQWPSGLPAEKIYQLTETASFMRPGDTGLFFLLTMPAEENIQALMHLSASGSLRRVSPAGINVRSRVHEYGGLPYCSSAVSVFYCDFASQRIMRQTFDQQTQGAGQVTALTPGTEDSAALRYADFIFDAARQRLICVREDHRNGNTVKNTLVAIDVHNGSEGKLLFSGTDFVASPRLSPDGSTLVFISWSHPDMPWDRTRLHIAALDEVGGFADVRTLPQDQPAAIVQPTFTPAGDLLFIADWNQWWNLYRLPASALGKGPTLAAVEHLVPLAADCCGPLWQLGVQNYACADDNTLVLSINRDCRWELACYDIARKSLETVQADYGALDTVAIAQVNGSPELLVCGSPLADAIRITSWSLDGGHAAAPAIRYRCASPALLPADAISPPEHLQFPGAGNSSAYGIYYAPCNPLYQAPDAEKPPLIVMVHGGPTSSAKLHYNPVIQFWTSRGFAVFDVNHHGSTGYGREFRHSLYGRWGEIDVADVIAGVKHLVNRGMADADKLAIRGGSAGGYVVLATLAACDLFGAGTSYYGVSDLSLLARDTHKFESHYLEQLIGPWPAARELYEERSPINHIDRIRAPVLLFQGLLDKVVPPNQAETVFTHLKPKNPASKLVLLADEAHGFRNPANQIRVLEQELAFYRSVLW
jgi:dipeptidyl aminopeptidase/acylaminoacyl peptidase